MARQRSWYLHTIEGKPAYFAGDRLVYCGGRHAKGHQPLVASLKQIKKERMASHIWRLSNGFESDIKRYGYVRVTVPAISVRADNSEGK